MSRPGISIVLVVIAGLISFTSAAGAQRVSAAFGSGEDSLDKWITFPDVKGEIDKTLICQGILKPNRKLDSPACYVVAAGDELYIEAINKAVKKARFIPAQFNGKDVGVYFQYRVQFLQKEGKHAIVLLPNQGYLENIDAYGDTFVAAQRVVSREKWENVCPRKAHFVVVTRSYVGEDGIQSSINLEHGSGITISPKCREAIIETLEQSTFMPALADGEPVPSSYVEAFGR
jgi:hypothetical protein